MGINRRSDVEERKNEETKAKARDEIPKERAGDASSRLETSEEPADDREKHDVAEKLRKRERGS